MALPAFLLVTGTTSGPIEGSVKLRGREGTILVLQVSHEVALLSSSSGAMRRRLHRPLVVVAEADKATPMLYSALAKAEVLSAVRLDMFRAQQSGAETNHFRIELSDAVVSNIKYSLPNVHADDEVQLTDFLEVSFEYATIKWTWIEGPIIAVDTWSPPA